MRRCTGAQANKAAAIIFADVPSVRMSGPHDSTATFWGAAWHALWTALKSFSKDVHNTAGLSWTQLMQKHFDQEMAPYTALSDDALFAVLKVMRGVDIENMPWAFWLAACEFMLRVAEKENRNAHLR